VAGIGWPLPSEWTDEVLEQRLFARAGVKPDVTDDQRPVGFNPITRIAPERQALAAAGIVSAFKHLWSDSWGPRLEHFLFHGVAALISPGPPP
jgi:hypothetical protein